MKVDDANPVRGSSSARLRALDGVAEMDAEIDRLQRADRCRRRGCDMPAEYGDLCERDHDYGCDEHS